MLSLLHPRHVARVVSNGDYTSIRHLNGGFAQKFKEKWPNKIPASFVGSVNKKYNLQIPDEHIDDYQTLAGDQRHNLQTVDELFEQHKPAIYPSSCSAAKDRAYETPEPYSERNLYGQWTATTKIAPINADGPLQGKTFGIKDNINVAGLPANNGSEIMQGYIANTDATVVTRILEAGGTIIGKTQCENLCYSGGSHTSHPVPVRNPHNPLHHAGGSSSGSGAAVACGACDIAIGGDQGGSIRLPSAWCGVVGFKQTWGLVPYTGAASLETHFDHLGPIAKTVDDVVQTLKVIGGKDGYDYRQLHAPPHNDAQFIRSLDAALQQTDVKNIKVGLVKQAFVDCKDNVDEYVRCAVQQLNAKKVVEVDVPIHNDMVAIWCSIGLSSQFMTMYMNGGWAPLPRGKYDVDACTTFSTALKSGKVQHSSTNITNLIAGEWMLEQFGAEFYGKGTELARIAKQEYERVMDENELDVLIYPTIKFCAPPLPIDVKQQTPKECAEHAFCNVANTMPSSVTGHPTLQIPVAYHNGLPVGMSIIAKDWDEAKCIHVANVYEQIRGPLKDL
eukprot:CAMPEP_0202700638 /NCGR_PEP_ID=MMETSP1385-20130828/13820_1 /ASSEMBLY_ACC=CAM_ASM_000861 /TAXON_ID=933848 /ORGANISM="Elphidium margaritaceum" /LENGTH=559 /DNA_ID=CAMNT_0049357871 /DNA_START=8 /DNA_END=1687 /DNA_ORIENTATION=-